MDCAFFFTKKLIIIIKFYNAHYIINYKNLFKKLFGKLIWHKNIL